MVAMLDVIQKDANSLSVRISVPSRPFIFSSSLLLSSLELSGTKSMSLKYEPVHHHAQNPPGLSHQAGDVINLLTVQGYLAHKNRPPP